MNRVWLICAVGLVLVLNLACGGTSGTGAAGASTGDKYILNGNGCPDKFTYVRAGGNYGGCRFEPGDITLQAFCDPNDIHATKSFMRFENGPLWRAGDTDSKRGLQVFWPGGGGVDGKGFACVKERCFDCE